MRLTCILDSMWGVYSRFRGTWMSASLSTWWCSEESWVLQSSLIRTDGWAGGSSAAPCCWLRCEQRISSLNVSGLDLDLDPHRPTWSSITEDKQKESPNDLDKLLWFPNIDYRPFGRRAPRRKAVSSNKRNEVMSLQIGVGNSHWHQSAWIVTT